MGRWKNKTIVKRNNFVNFKTKYPTQIIIIKKKIKNVLITRCNLAHSLYEFVVFKVTPKELTTLKEKENLCICIFNSCRMHLNFRLHAPKRFTKRIQFACRPVDTVAVAASWLKGPRDQQISTEKQTMRGNRAPPYSVFVYILRVKWVRSGAGTSGDQGPLSSSRNTACTVAHTLRRQRAQCATIMRRAVIVTGPNVIWKSGIPVLARFLPSQVGL